MSREALHHNLAAGGVHPCVQKFSVVNSFRALIQRVEYGHKAGVARNGNGTRIYGVAVVPAHEAVAAVGGSVDYRQRIGAGWRGERLHGAHPLIGRRCREGKVHIFDEIGKIAPPTIVGTISATWDVNRYGGGDTMKSIESQ